MWKNRNLMFLWLAQILSAAGNTFTFLAIAVQVDNLFPDPGASARALSGIFIAAALPQLLFGLVAGTFVDRWDRKKVMIAADVLSALLIPAYLLVQDAGDLPLAYLVSFLASICSIFFFPSRTALLPSLVKEDELLSANGWMQVGQTMARLAGPALGGIVVGAWGTRVAFIVDSASFLVSALLVMGISGVETRVSMEGQASEIWTELKAGIRFVVDSRLLQGITIGLAFAMLGMGAVNVLFVPFLRGSFNVAPQGLGMIMTSQGVGMLVGGLLMGSLGKKLTPVKIAVAGMALLGVAIGIMGMAPSFIVAMLVVPFIGLGIPPLNASLQTMLQRGVPGEMMGRASSVMDVALSLAAITAMASAGWLAAGIGIRQTYIAGGGLILLGGVMMYWLLRGVKLDQEQPEEKMAIAARVASD